LGSGIINLQTNDEVLIIVCIWNWV